MKYWYKYLRTVNIRILYSVDAILLFVFPGCSNSNWSLVTEIEKWNSYINSTERDYYGFKNEVKLHDSYINMHNLISRDVDKTLELNNPVIVMFYKYRDFYTYDIIIFKYRHVSLNWEFNVWDSISKRHVSKGSVDLGPVDHIVGKFKLLSGKCEANEGVTGASIIIAWLYAYQSTYMSAFIAPFRCDEKDNILIETYKKTYSSFRR